MAGSGSPLFLILLGGGWTAYASRINDIQMEVCVVQVGACDGEGAVMGTPNQRIGAGEWL